MNAIVVTFDRLPVGFLGCCGNGWIATPNFDRLAAQSALFHQHFADCAASDSTCRAWWSGRSGCRDAGKDARGPELSSLLAEAGVTFRVLVETTHERHESETRFPPDCTESVRGIDGLDVPPDETPFFRLVARAQRDLRLLRTSRKEPWLLWIKSRGVPIPWLAPRAFATQFLEVSDDEETDHEQEEHDDADGDRDAQDLVEMSGAQFDDLLQSMAELPAGRKSRDALSGVERGLMRKVCGGYVALLDAALGRLLDQVDEAATTPTLLVVSAARGLTLREPGLLRDEWEQLAEETVHTPLFVRPAGMNRGIRRQELVQTVDLFPTLAEWFGIGVSGAALDGKSLLPGIRGEEGEPRACAVIADGKRLAGIRTSEYYLVSRQDDGAVQADGEPGERRRLFAKPEDIWETNDIAAQSPDVVEQLAAQLAPFVAGQTRSA